ncbi:thiol:disulfide interchange protein DsbA/DsbL [Pseudoxanthomonas indica]|uniref:Thiol:disulfide interchange protein DsbA n=1 Tax=Pseudoxanthomonas indica TaxID=428993 RepID=A0A1T5KVA8_9GAMM|nr:thiol:disulfide interchange protein DsbA/DsbL [Pseudoxanthomonas indica]GGD52158.1 hypothetical protein GCM10007235_25480 [Pseudoxanthomonas indica]SKC67716.1 Thiol:disulfide interchange protein DsbA [Pseudoxanthomonas indica]
MKLRHYLLAFALLPLLAACGPKEESTVTPAADAPASAPAETPAPAADAAAPAADGTAAPAADAAAPAAPDAGAAAAAPAPAPIVPAGPAPVPGVDYVLIPNGQPFLPLNGKIEVVEVFGYVCPACASFQGQIMPWRKTLPADVRLTYVPVAFGPEWQPYAQAFYAAESKGLVERTHDAVFTQIHANRSLPGEGQKPDPAKVAAFYAGYGVDAKEFLGLMNSFGTSAKINRAKQFAMAAGVSGTPSLVVNGKYLVKGRSFPDMLRITDALIAQERAAK